MLAKGVLGSHWLLLLKHVEGILPKGPYPPCLRMADRALLAGYPRCLPCVAQVVDSSDVLIQVLDCRDPMGTRSKHIEEYLRKEKPHKHLILVLNKCDLVPTWLTVSPHSTYTMDPWNHFVNYFYMVLNFNGNLICFHQDSNSLITTNSCAVMACTGIILWMRPANERWRYNLMSSPIG